MIKNWYLVPSPRHKEKTRSDEDVCVRKGYPAGLSKVNRLALITDRSNKASTVRCSEMNLKVARYRFVLQEFFSHVTRKSGPFTTDTFSATAFFSVGGHLLMWRKTGQSQAVHSS